MPEPQYKRILLKISGEALAGDKHFGLDFQVMGQVADVIRECVAMGVQVGVVIGGVFMHFDINQSSVQLALLFGTTLAPISGYFGWPFGIVAGFLHSSVVLHAGTPVEGINLYNNGFSGGLLAIILYPTIVAIARHRKPVITEAEYFDHMEHDEPETPPPVQDMIEEED